MKNLLKEIIAFCFIILIASGCVSQPSNEELMSADYGYFITNDDAKKLAKDWLDKKLKDPFSAQYNFGTIERGYAVAPIINGGTKYFGYRLIVNVNAKNSYGGYTGYQEYQFMFKNGNIEVVIGPPEGQYGIRPFLR